MKTAIIIAAAILASAVAWAGSTIPSVTWALQIQTRTVSQLPAAAAGNVGFRAFVTDATACTFGGAITGGGSTKCPVYSTGAAWVGG